MYPAHVFSFFPPFPREDKVFVAMSFDDRLRPRWEQVIAPAIRDVIVDGVPMEPVRVDNQQVSDSILTEIVRAISTSRLVFADITALDELNGRPIVNGNAMYEVGLAHAVRQPQEVVLFRSDSRNILFDLANIRINHYDPDGDTNAAKRALTATLQSAVQEIELEKGMAVEAAVNALDFYAATNLPFPGDTVEQPTIITMGDAVVKPLHIAGIQRMVEFGILKVDVASLNGDELTRLQASGQRMEPLFRYKLTPFGTVVQQAFLARMGLPDMQGSDDDSLPGT